MITYDTNVGHMKRRSLIFQEVGSYSAPCMPRISRSSLLSRIIHISSQQVLFIMSRLPNVYNRPRYELNKFQFGFVNKKTFDDVKLVHPDRGIYIAFPFVVFVHDVQYCLILQFRPFPMFPRSEDEPIADLLGRTDFFEHDVVIVPLSQVDLPPPIHRPKSIHRNCIPFII